MSKAPETILLNLTRTLRTPLFMLKLLRRRNFCLAAITLGTHFCLPDFNDDKVIATMQKNRLIVPAAADRKKEGKSKS